MFDAAGFEILVDPLAGLLTVRRRLSAGSATSSVRSRRRRFALAGALEEGVAFKLPFDIGGQIQVRELQQLDGLHQLRRHHERLALPHLKFLRQRHRWAELVRFLL